MRWSEFYSNYLSLSKKEKIHEDDQYHIFMTYRRYFPRFNNLFTKIRNIGIWLYLLVMLIYLVFFSILLYSNNLVYDGLMVLFTIVIFGSKQVALYELAEGDTWEILTKYYVYKPDISENSHKKLSYYIHRIVDVKQDSFSSHDQAKFKIYRLTNKIPKRKNPFISLGIAGRTLTIPTIPTDALSDHYVPKELEIYDVAAEQYLQVENRFSWYNFVMTFNLIVLLGGFLVMFILFYYGIETDQVGYFWLSLLSFIIMMAILLRSWISSIFNYVLA